MFLNVCAQQNFQFAVALLNLKTILKNYCDTIWRDLDKLEDHKIF